MKTISKVEQEVNQIRLRIYEEIKNLTPEQNKERLERVCAAAQKKYGFKRIARANKTDRVVSTLHLLE